MLKFLQWACHWVKHTTTIYTRFSVTLPMYLMSYTKTSLPSSNMLLDYIYLKAK